MTPENETDSRTLVEAQLRESGWNPADKREVRTEMSAVVSQTGGNLVVSFRRCACVKCGLFILDPPYLADIFLHDQIEKRTEEILGGYGIKERAPK